jgi:hypothetical protein
MYLCFEFASFCKICTFWCSVLQWFIFKLYMDVTINLPLPVATHRHDPSILLKSMKWRQKCVPTFFCSSVHLPACPVRPPPASPLHPPIWFRRPNPSSPSRPQPPPLRLLSSLSSPNVAATHPSSPFHTTLPHVPPLLLSSRHRWLSFSFSHAIVDPFS